MADAYLCPMPMTYEMLTQIPFTAQLAIVSGYYQEIEIDATGYTYFSITIPEKTINVRLSHASNGASSGSGRFHYYISNGSSRLEGSESEWFDAPLSGYVPVTIPEYTYQGPLNGNSIRIGIDDNQEYIINYSWGYQGTPINITGYFRR